MTEVKNGRIMAPVAETKDGVARVLTSGQRCANRASMAKKLQRYMGDPRFSVEDKKMYGAQFEDLYQEAKAAGSSIEEEIASHEKRQADRRAAFNKKNVAAE